MLWLGSGSSLLRLQLSVQVLCLLAMIGHIASCSAAGLHSKHTLHSSKG